MPRPLKEHRGRPYMGQIETLIRGVYSARELRLILARYRQKSVPPRTFRRWKQYTGIEPDVNGFYDENDLKTLIRLIKWLAKDGTLESFKNQLRIERNAD